MSDGITRAVLRRTSTQSDAALVFLSVKSEESGAPRGARTLAGGKPVQAICHLTGRGRDGMNGDVHSRGSLNRVSRRLRKRTGIASLSKRGWRDRQMCAKPGIIREGME